MFRFYRKKIIALLLTVCFLVTVVAPGLAQGAENTGNSLQEARDGIVGYYLKNKTTLNRWREVAALKEAGQNVANAPWTLPDWKTDQLNSGSQPSDYAGAILGMLAAGENPKDVGGRNLVDELAALQDSDGGFTAWLNQTTWAVIALDQAGGNYNTAKAVEYLISQQKSDGGFALSGDVGDPDTTGDALLFLAVHQDIAGVSDSINRAKNCLKSLQLSNGGFASWGTENPESVAAVIRGLLACGEDLTSGDWKKENGNMIDALFSFQLEDGSFVHQISDTKYDAMATEQALLAAADLVGAGAVYTVRTGKKHTVNETRATVRVRVEGAGDSLKDAKVQVTGTALDALKAAAGEKNVVEAGGFVTSILGESGKKISDEISTSWMYYVIRNGAIEKSAFSQGAGGFNVRDGDEVIFYMGAMDNNWAPKTFFPVVSVSPQSPRAGQSITLTIKPMKYDWTADDLIDLTPQELEAVGEYTVLAGGKTYVTDNGHVDIKAVQAGTLSFVITNGNEAGYPDVVTYKGDINVQAAVEEETGEGAKADIPKTGDDNSLSYIFGAALFFSGVLIVCRKRRGNAERKQA
jgi:LPXTG-motif cell wall-anchored protein